MHDWVELKHAASQVSLSKCLNATMLTCGICSNKNNTLDTEKMVRGGGSKNQTEHRSTFVH